MMLKNVTIGKKLALGFGALLIIVLLMGILSFRGMGKIVGNAEEIIHGNQLDRTLAQKEVDHLNWAAQVSSLLRDDTVTELAAQTDDHRCGFGQWLYSDARKEAERRFPVLVPILREIEQPHRQLHDSAIEINKHFCRADAALPGLIARRMVDHIKWADAIRDAFLENKTEVAVQTDPTQCALGKWLQSEAAKTAYEHANQELRQSWDAMLISHERLHKSAIDIHTHIGNGDQGHAETRKLFSESTLPLLHGTLAHLESMGDTADRALTGRTHASEIYACQTLPSLEQTRTLLHRARETAQENIMSENAMLRTAAATKRNVGFVAAIGILARVALALLIGKGIISALRRVISSLKEGAEQVAAASGQVSTASQSLAEGATEQAAGLEEASASLEEMSSMTRQNAANAEESASASEELSAQAESMNEVVSKLVALVGGSDAPPAGADRSRVRLTVNHNLNPHESMKPHGFGRFDETFHKIAERGQHKVAGQSSPRNVPSAGSPEGWIEFGE